MSSSYYTMRSLSPARRRVLEQHRRFGLKTGRRSSVNQLLEAVSPYEECIEVKAVSEKAAGAEKHPGQKKEPVDVSAGAADVVFKEDDDPAGVVDPPAPLELERTVDGDDGVDEREPAEEHIYRELEEDPKDCVVLTGIPTEVVILPTSSTVVSSSESSSTTSSVNVRTLTPPISFDGDDDDDDDNDASTSHHNDQDWDDDQEDEWPSDEERSVNNKKPNNNNNNNNN